VDTGSELAASASPYAEPLTRGEVSETAAPTTLTHIAAAAKAKVEQGVKELILEVSAAPASMGAPWFTWAGPDRAGINATVTNNIMRLITRYPFR
jgi:hypothetical protein